MIRLLIIIIITLLILSGCGNENTQEKTNIIPYSSEVCSSQSLKNEALWVYLNDWYYWNNQLDQSTPFTEFESLNALLTDVKKKNPIDRWSNATDSAKAQAFTQSGQSIGYGILATLDHQSGELLVGLVYQDSDAYRDGLRRGDSITQINHQSIEDGLANGSFTQDNFWGEQTVGEILSITWRDSSHNIKESYITQNIFQMNTVINTQIIESASQRIGYMVFQHFIQISEQELNQAFSFYSKNNIDELIIDIRYNGGGLSSIANQLASQIAGDNVFGDVFARYVHNENHHQENSEELFSLNGGEDSLNLDQVLFLTTKHTGSASEMLINSLSPHINVLTIGQPTHGKPVGFKAVELCDETIYAANVTVQNSESVGDYFEGIPVNCHAQDSVQVNWGDKRDPLLKEALYLIEHQQCSALGSTLTPTEKSF